MDAEQIEDLLVKAVENELRKDPDLDADMIAIQLGVKPDDVENVIGIARDRVGDVEPDDSNDAGGSPWWDVDREWTLPDSDHAKADRSGEVVLKGRDNVEDVTVDLNDLPGEEVLVSLAGQVVNLKVRTDTE